MSRISLYSLSLKVLEYLRVLKSIKQNILQILVILTYHAPSISHQLSWLEKINHIIGYPAHKLYC